MKIFVFNKPLNDLVIFSKASSEVNNTQRVDNNTTKTNKNDAKVS